MFSKQKYPDIYLDIIGILLSHGAVFVTPLTVQVHYPPPHPTPHPILSSFGHPSMVIPHDFLVTLVVAVVVPF